jgi:putative membrane protein
MIRTVALAALAIALAAPAARAQATAPGSSPVNDQLFAEAAAVQGVTEVTISELGLQMATDPDLKKFSQQMVAEHNRMNQELTTLAAKKRIALPRTIDPRAQFCVQSLRGTPREKFDHCYAKAQLTAHMESLAAFEAESERGQDADLRALAARAVPKIKEHLNQIKPIAQKFEKEHAEGSDKGGK